MEYQKACDLHTSFIQTISGSLLTDGITISGHKISEYSVSFHVRVKVIPLIHDQSRQKAGRRKIGLQTHSVVYLHGNL